MKLCSIAECGAPSRSRGWCRRHYLRWYKTGSTSDTPLSRTLTTLDRFLAKVTKRPDGCWEWTGARRDGYGRFRHAGKMRAAHRWAYEHFVGPIPDGLDLDHSCRRHWCVNPEHLDPATRQENTLRGEGIAARWADRTHCGAGHEFTAGNVYRTPAGARRCRACARSTARYRRWRTAVLARDEGRCRECGTDERVQAHHVLPWATCPEARYDIDNGHALCRPCHDDLHAQAA